METNHTFYRNEQNILQIIKSNKYNKVQTYFAPDKIRYLKVPLNEASKHFDRKMDSRELRKYGKQMIDYVCDYRETLHTRRVISAMEPGYLQLILPNEAPQKGESWDDIMKDVEEKIMPGVTHWQHPRFNAYFPNGGAFTGILGDILSAAIGCVGFSWAASPACTELETIVLDWFGKALNLPPEFLFSAPNSNGGGVIQSSASECILVCILAARNEAIKYLKEINGTPDDEDNIYLPKLVAYCSKEAHSCVEKNCKIALVALRILDVDERGSFRGPVLQKAIDEDVEKGLHPFFVFATVGTTGTCSFDNLSELGAVAEKQPACWFHVDGAYAGNSFICPEFRYLMKGIQYAHSFNTNCNKWLMVCYDCSCLWVKDKIKLTSAMIVDPLYLRHEKSKVTIDYRHWGIPLSRRFRSLKLWFTLRYYGIENLQKYIRNHCELAKYFETLVKIDCRFEVCNEVKSGLVCFRLKGTDLLNQLLLSSINSSADLHMIPSMFQDRYIIRFCVIYHDATKRDIDDAWEIIRTHAATVLKYMQAEEKDKKVERKLSRKYSFVRSVSREIYEKRNSRNSLNDEVAGILIVNHGNSVDGPYGLEDVFEDQNLSFPNKKDNMCKDNV